MGPRGLVRGVRAGVEEARSEVLSRLFVTFLSLARSANCSPARGMGQPRDVKIEGHSMAKDLEYYGIFSRCYGIFHRNSVSEVRSRRRPADQRR